MPNKSSAPKKRFYRRRGPAKKRAKVGLNKKEKQQVSNMIKGKRETFYLNTIQYALGQAVQTTYERHHLVPKSCFQSGNKITMIGLTSADSFSSIGNDVNSNSTHTGGQRLYLTGGCRARDIGGNPDATLDGDMGYMKSHLQRIKIHAIANRSTSPGPDKMNPLNFRVLVVQVNGSKPAGDVPSFTNVGSTGSPSLFRDRLDFKIGIDDQILPYEFTNNLRVDTKAFKLVRDIRFKLSTPLQVVSGETTSYHQYPATKELDIWLPQPKKPVKFDAGTQLPTNYDYRYYTFVFCSNDSTYNAAALGTTEDRWYLESTSIARVQEY